MKVLITGITGFAGSHLAEYLLEEKEAEVHGLYRWRSRTENIEGFRDEIRLYEGDIRDSSSMRELIARIKPDWIFHLAAQSYVPMSWKAPQETLSTNVMGELNLLEACRNEGCDPKIHVAGSSEEYGMVHPEEIPITEDNPLRPLSPYAVSKVTQDMLGYQYHQSYGLRVVRTRAFNHTGPRRGRVFVTSNFARQIAAIEKGKKEPVIKVGNLEAVRDFTDVRDIVKAYVLALEKGEPGQVYNLGSGKGIKIGELLQMLLKMSEVEIRTERDPARMRPSDVQHLVCDFTKFGKKTGWQPEIPFEKTLEDILEFWRARV